MGKNEQNHACKAQVVVVLGNKKNTMATQKSITTLHGEHKEWINKLSFYTDDLRVLQHRLDETSNKNNSKEFTAGLEDFQNQLLVQHGQIEILNHHISEHEAALENSVIKNPVASDHRTMHDHSEQREKMADFEELFASLRKELMGFLSKWM